MELGEKLYFYRTRAELSQGELAERLEVSRQSVSKWETGASIPELDKLVRICDVYGITLDELVKGDPAEASEQNEPEDVPETDTPRPVPAPPADRMASRDRALSDHRRKMAAIILLCFGAALFLLPAVFGLGFAGLVPAIPFLLCGGVCMAFRRYVGLWCAWVVYACVSVYIGVCTGTYPFSFIAYIRYYQLLEGQNIHIIISLALFCWLSEPSAIAAS